MPSFSPLSGLRVLEFGQRSSAAFAGRWFVDAGAEVVRLQSGRDRVGSDATRSYLERGKALIGVDWQSRHALDEVTRLAAECDIVVADLSPSQAAQLDWTELAMDSRLSVRTLITPQGSTGPGAHEPATPATLLARSGHTYLLGDPDRAPLTLPADYVGYQAGLFAYTASLAALLETRGRQKAEAVSVEVCELEVLASLHQHTTVMHTYAGTVRKRRGNQYDGTYPITIVPCADGWLGVCIVATFWEAFCRWLDPAWLEDARFADSPSRQAHAAELDQEMARAVAGRRKHELEHEGQLAHRVPVGAANTLVDLIGDPHLRARDFWSWEPVGDRTIAFPSRPYVFVGEEPTRETPDGRG